MPKTKLIGSRALWASLISPFVIAGLLLAEGGQGAPAKPSSPDRVGPPVIEAPQKPAPAAAVKPSTPTSAAPAVGATAAAAPADKKPAPASPPGGARFAPVLPQKDAAPPSLFVGDPRYDFGDVIKGEVVSHRFEVENKG